MSILECPVCLAADHKYDDSMGAYTVFWLFDGESVYTEGGMYSNLGFNHYTVNATVEQKKQALAIHMATVPETHNYNKYANSGRGAYTFVGCTVKLARSRKAPNKKDLKVVGFNDRYYNDFFGNWVDETVDLIDTVTGDTYNNISINCIKEVVKGVKEEPFWAPL